MLQCLLTVRAPDTVDLACIGALLLQLLLDQLYRLRPKRLRVGRGRGDWTIGGYRLAEPVREWQP